MTGIDDCISRKCQYFLVDTAIKFADMASYADGAPSPTHEQRVASKQSTVCEIANTLRIVTGRVDDKNRQSTDLNGIPIPQGPSNWNSLRCTKHAHHNTRKRMRVPVLIKDMVVMSVRKQKIAGCEFVGFNGGFDLAHRNGGLHDGGFPRLTVGQNIGEIPVVAPFECPYSHDNAQLVCRKSR